MSLLVGIACLCALTCERPRHGTTRIAPGVECAGVQVERSLTSNERNGGEVGVAATLVPCQSEARAWRLRVDLDRATLRVLTGPSDDTGIEPVTPLDLMAGRPWAEGHESTPVRAVAAVNGGFFAAAQDPGRLISVSTLRGLEDQQLAEPVDLGRLPAAARCRVHRRSALALRCSPDGCSASIERELTANGRAREGPMAAHPAGEIIAWIGGGGSLLPEPASSESTALCPGGPGQPDPDWDRPRPRTAVGLLRSERFDGPRSQVIDLLVSSGGLTVAELAEVGRQLGWERGLALDGGGSSQLWIRERDRVRHFGGERLLASALVVYAPVR